MHGTNRNIWLQNSFIGTYLRLFKVQILRTLIKICVSCHGYNIGEKHGQLVYCLVPGGIMQGNFWQMQIRTQFQKHAGVLLAPKENGDMF